MTMRMKVGATASFTRELQDSMRFKDFQELVWKRLSLDLTRAADEVYGTIDVSTIRFEETRDARNDFLHNQITLMAQAEMDVPDELC